MRSVFESAGVLSGRELLGVVVAALLICVLPNLFVWLAAGHFGLGRSLFNLDYALIVALMALGYWRTGLILVAACLLIDMLSLAVQVFPFMRLQDAAYLARFLWIAPADYKLWLIIALAAFVCVLLLF